MKRLLLVLILLFTLVSSAYSISLIGSGIGTACGQTETQEIQESNHLFAYTGGFEYNATSFTAAGAGTYSIKTVYILLKKMGSPAHVITMYLCANNAGDPAAGGTAADATLDSSTVTDNYLWYKFNYTSGYSVTNGTKYWIKLAAGTSHTTNYLHWGYKDAVTGQAIKRSSDDSSWVQTAAGQGDFKITTCLE